VVICSERSAPEPVVAGLGVPVGLLEREKRVFGVISNDSILNILEVRLVNPAAAPRGRMAGMLWHRTARVAADGITWGAR
jgi:hypothetical protein